jgi:hypothetical protein
MKHSITYILFILLILVLDIIFNVRDAFALTVDQINQNILNCPVASIRISDNVRLEEEIVNIYSKEDLEFILKLRLQFFYDYCLSYKNYYSYLHNHLNTQSLTLTQKAEIVNEYMGDFYIHWQLKYKDFLLKIIASKIK